MPERAQDIAHADFERGRRAERLAIVKWLRGLKSERPDIDEAIATMIEKRRHHD